MRKHAPWIYMLLLWSLGSLPTRASLRDLTDLSLEELMDIQVITVSKREHRLFESPAAAYVLTHDDIRRAGARTIPEALRLVPGMQVARVDANKWVVTARGFAGLFANKLLVMIDGRSVYTPLFSGVFWEAQDVVLEDVARIEVIRGPGGTLWGANAVNGIVNIITRTAADTQGGFVQAGGGTEERGFATVRYGGVLSKGVAFRVYGKGSISDALVDSAGQTRADDWWMRRAGFRLDWSPSAHHTLALKGDLYDGEVGQALSLNTAPSPPYVQTVYFDAQVSGGSLLGRWEQGGGKRADMALQVYYDQSDRKEVMLQGVIHNTDIDFQHRFGLGRRCETVWGLGYRFTTDSSRGSFTVSLQPDHRNVHLFSGFIHQEVSLAPDRLRVSAGAKIEHNSHTGFEVQPDARIWWSPTRRQAVWAAVSRAVRTPSRADEDVLAMAQTLPAGALFAGSPVTLIRLQGNRQAVSEEVLAFDWGYRVGLSNRFSTDVCAFYNLYDNLRTNEPDLSALEVSAAPLHITVPVQVDNKAHGWTCGFELAADWNPLEQWRLSAGYSFLRMRLEVAEDSFDTTTETWDEEAPEHQLSVRSHLDLPGNLELNAVGRYVGDLPTQHIPGYFALDVHMGWRPGHGIELSLVGQHLLAGRHLEFISSSSGILPARVQAGVYGALAWRF